MATHEISRLLLIALIQYRHMTRRCQLLYQWPAHLLYQKGRTRCYLLTTSKEGSPNSSLPQQHLALGRTHLV